MDASASPQVPPDLQHQHVRMEIQLLKGKHEFSGFIFAKVPQHEDKGVLFIQDFMPNSFVMAHNAFALEENMADGVLPQDMIIQVNFTTGPSQGRSGGESLIKAINASDTCLIVIVRRADRLENYMARCNDLSVRFEQHIVKFSPPDEDIAMQPQIVQTSPEIDA